VAQDDPNAYPREMEFMCGDHLLISHVSQPGMTEKKVYLPKGVWFNYWNDTTFSGGQEVTVATPLKEIPLFVKAGAVIPKYPRMQYVGEKPITEMSLHVYYSEEVTRSVLYEDAGDNYGYLDGQYNVIRFKQISDRRQVRLKKKYVGNFQIGYQRYRVIFHGIPFRPTEYVIDGRVYRLNAKNFAIGTVKVLADRQFEEIIIR
jgi:alpha-glucosidase